MDTSNHCSMATLFDQLGLPSQVSQIDAFIESHSIPARQKIDQATFWNGSQSSFLAEGLAQDSDWTELIEQLDAQLRK